MRTPSISSRVTPEVPAEFHVTVLAARALWIGGSTRTRFADLEGQSK